MVFVFNCAQRFKCVRTTARNNKNEYPEHRSMKTAIKKMVCKVRQARADKELE